MPPRRLRATLLCAMACLCCALANSAEPTQLVLTNAAQIRQLSATQAARSLPVLLRGVIVTEAGPSPERAAVIWDETAGIYLLGSSNEFSTLIRGDLIEVTGATDPGQFAPMVKLSSLRKLGSAPVPEPRQATFEALLSGILDAQWIEISGVVRSLETNVPGGFGQWHMDLAVPGGKLSVLSNGDKPDGVAPDAQVRVKATCFYQFTQNRQVLRPMLLVPNRVPVEVLHPPPSDVQELPIRPVGSLLEFSPASAWGHRVHVRGVVTRQDPGTFVWIRDSSGALRIQSRQTERLEPGDDIDVLGFPKYGSFIPALEDAIFQKASRGKPPVPIDLPGLEAAFEHQADLVAIAATLTDVQRLPDGWIFKLQKDGTPFNAVAKFGDVAGASDWRPGSLVRASGICSVLGDESEPVLSGIWRPQSFELLLRSPADLQILKAPPWWTPRHIILALLAATAASVLVTGTVMLLARRRLREQANRRAMAEAEFTAILSERNRVAREIHDTLAQGLVATSVHLRLAKKSINGSSEPLIHHLDAAQDLVRDSLEEARNSIWNMRSQILETSDLAGALGGILQQMADGSELKTGLEVRGRPRRLSPVLENNILRIGQEAISNAVRHAAARSVSVTLVFGEREFELGVLDDGRGFSPDKPAVGKGGFGLVGMRERADHIKADLQICSTPDRGTQVSLRLPLSSE